MVFLGNLKFLRKNKIPFPLQIFNHSKKNPENGLKHFPDLNLWILKISP
jgi:hypothetical protein